MADGPPAPEEVPRVRAHGAEIPALGLGTWELSGGTARRITARALEAGYRHVDTASAYGNEAEVGRAIEGSEVDRDDVFLTTKVWPDDYRPDAFRSAMEASLDRLRTDRVDLLLLHWPKFEGTSLEATVDALNEARDRGRARHIGVCNFTTALLERAVERSRAPLAVNQVEYHPYLDQGAVLEAVRRREMALTAYSPLAQGRVAEGGGSGGEGLVGRAVRRLSGRGDGGEPDPVLDEIGARHGKTAAQVALRWLVQQEGVTAIPRTSNPRHLRENLEIFDFELEDREMRRIHDLARPDGRILDPPGLAPGWD